MAKYFVMSTREYLPTTPFHVTGGCFARGMNMGLHITTEKGFTLAVSCDKTWAEKACKGAELIDHILEIKDKDAYKRIMDFVQMELVLSIAKGSTTQELLQNEGDTGGLPEPSEDDSEHSGS
jgi:hypothetical protein